MPNRSVSNHSSTNRSPGRRLIAASIAVAVLAAGCVGGDRQVTAESDERTDSDIAADTTADVGHDFAPEVGDTTTEDAADAPDVPGGPPVVLHDPTSGDLLSFPDDFFTVEDPTTRTGLRVHVDAENQS